VLVLLVAVLALPSGLRAPAESETVA
jgi:hypothetical protein